MWPLRGSNWASAVSADCYWRTSGVAGIADTSCLSTTIIPLPSALPFGCDPGTPLLWAEPAASVSSIDTCGVASIYIVHLNQFLISRLGRWVDSGLRYTPVYLFLILFFCQFLRSPFIRSLFSFRMRPVFASKRFLFVMLKASAYQRALTKWGPLWPRFLHRRFLLFFSACTLATLLHTYNASLYLLYPFYLLRGTGACV